MSAIARHFTPVRTFGLAVVAALVWGYTGHLERYINPNHGLGYWLGIVGGSLMLVVLIYPARTRVEWLKVLGGVTGWFRAHMTLGVIGPLLVLFHSNFSLGATNSNVALFCMLAVAGSGLIGRYIYSRVYGDWYDHKSTLEELQATAEQLRKQTSTVAVLPELLEAIEVEEKRLFRPARNPLGALLFPVTIGLRSVMGRWRLQSAIRRMIVQAAQQSPTLAAHGSRLTNTAMNYADRRLDSARRVREHGVYVKLFSLWHFLHVPFFIMTLVAAVVHIVAVHIY
jgi:hypothetical protein